MRRLLLLPTLLGLLSCSGTSPEPVKPKPIECQILRLTPPPVLNPDVCGDQNCLSVADTVRLSLWIGHVEETRRDLDRCPLVQLVDPS